MGRKKTDFADKKKYLDFVYLSDEEHAKLCELLGKEATDRWIDELNGALGQHGYKYASHFWTIRNWARRAAAKVVASLFRGDGEKAADRVIELLKDPQSSLPTGDEKIKLAVYATLSARGVAWPRLRMLLREGRLQEADIRAEFLKHYKP